MANNGGGRSSAPQPERWYELRLGSSFKDRPSSKFCTLRYEFKPASIDKNQAGTLHKTKDNRVTVEFNNNQLGRPKLTFEGTSEDYKDNDGVLFFDGETFRLERLHRAVKRLRHVRQPGEFVTGVNNASTVTNALVVESRSPPLAKTMKPQTLNKSINHAMPLEVERIDIGDPENSAGSKPSKTTSDIYSTLPNPFPPSPHDKTHEPDDSVDILEEDESSPPKANLVESNLSNQADTDDEIADVDASDGEGNKGPNAAEALRAQVNAAEEGQQREESSSSSGSSESSGSGSGSGSSSDDSDDSDGDSATSAGEIDI
ncbi:ELL-associated factor 1-like [Phalaenopsis equestris]|uniref:ELL-associated factor 1-like n=1 Tax=Phalaenopsis equestris TaxID=78828 RepID=UPI0009E37109|nr:ELL-associated factor 1-like [Phalaenopsis equestris]